MHSLRRVNFFVLCLLVGWSSLALAAPVDVLNLSLVTPRAQPQVNTLRVRSVTMNFDVSTVEVAYQYGNGTGANFVPGAESGSVTFQGAQIQTFLDNFLNNSAPILKTGLQNKLGTPLQ